MLSSISLKCNKINFWFEILIITKNNFSRTNRGIHSRRQIFTYVDDQFQILSFQKFSKTVLLNNHKEQILRSLRYQKYSGWPDIWKVIANFANFAMWPQLEKVSNPLISVAKN